MLDKQSYTLETYNGKHCLVFSPRHWPPTQTDEGYCKLSVPMSMEMAELLYRHQKCNFRVNDTILGFPVNDIILENLIAVQAPIFFDVSEWQTVDLIFYTFYREEFAECDGCFAVGQNRRKVKNDKRTVG